MLFFGTPMVHNIHGGGGLYHYVFCPPYPPLLIFPAGVEMFMPGDNKELTLTLKHDIPLEMGQRFTLRDGGKTIGYGVVNQIIQ